MTYIEQQKNKNDAKTIYREITVRKFVIILMTMSAIVIFFLIDVMTGPALISIREVISTILSPAASDQSVNVIVWTYRLPVALTAIVIGASLGLAGANMQTILDNPLASPYTLGISAAAGFGAALAMVLGVGVFPFASKLIVAANAFMFALISCFLIYGIARFKKATTETIVLTGIAVLFLFDSLLALLQFIADPMQIQAIVFWIFGSLTKTTWESLGVNVVVLLLAIPILAMDIWKLTALRLGDEKAKSLGVNVERLRLKGLILVSILTATAVAFVGTIGFVGLVAPHISRMLVGEDQRFFLPFSALTGALMLSIASILSKVIIPGLIFPVGILTSLIGIPFFIWLILSKRRGYW